MKTRLPIVLQCGKGHPLTDRASFRRSKTGARICRQCEESRAAVVRMRQRQAKRVARVAAREAARTEAAAHDTVVLAVVKRLAAAGFTFMVGTTVAPKDIPAYLRKPGADREAFRVGRSGCACRSRRMVLAVPAASAPAVLAMPVESV